MKVILTEKVRSLGNIGEIVNVSPGHARNFLFPKGFALFADEKNTRVLENQKRALRKKIDAQREEALAVKEKLDGLEVALTKKVGASGKLFGAVTTRELAQYLAQQGIDVERRLMTLEAPIKSVGVFKVKVKLYQDVEGEFQVKVEMNPKQLEELQRKAKAAASKKKKAALEPEAEQALVAEGGEEEVREQELDVSHHDDS